ncbi:MAG: BREX-1 system adenine-specific DNA-methyltransferase PglX [Pontiella sp.]
METAQLKKMAQGARRYLIEQVGYKLNQILTTDSGEYRDSRVVKDLMAEVRQHGDEQVIERVAYIWFNRFCALRFMDANGYNRTAVVSPTAGFTLPELLQEAKQGHIDDTLANQLDRAKLSALLAEAKQDEAYQMLLVAACNQLSDQMPYLFEKIADYTELLMPSDLLSEKSILSKIRDAMTEKNCQDVEVIGWLYQFYISEKKDEVFAGLKQNKKITPENIPAATQLFTPNWIVRYLVENSLGRLWMLNRPNSRLKDHMEYYIEPQQDNGEPQNTQKGSSSESSVVKEDFLRVNSPEELKVCDPACGSGHMLTYAFDLLYAIYEEEGYDAPEIPGLILENNLFGVELDERAGELAAFALTMKARAKYRRFFRKPVQPNICVLEKVTFEDGELKSYMDEMGRDLFSSALQQTVLQFDEADNFGSLIVPQATDVAELHRQLEAKDMGGQLFLHGTHKKVMQALKMADYLSPKYHCVVANPPYMGSKGMNPSLRNHLQKHYKDAKSDLMTCFMDRAVMLCLPNGYWGMINLPSWLFLSSFEKFRLAFLSNVSISSFLHLGRGIFGADFGSVAFCVKNSKADKGSTGIYRRLFEKHVLVRNSEKIRQLFLDSDYGYFEAKQSNFSLIPGSPLAYWITETVTKSFLSKRLGEFSKICGGMSTSNNTKFLRYWHEVQLGELGLSLDQETALKSGYKWFPYNKGGECRKWFGNREYVVNWLHNGEEIKFAVVNNPSDPNTTHWSRRVFNTECFFKEGLTWGDVSSGTFSARIHPQGSISDGVGIGAYEFPDEETKLNVLSLLNSKMCKVFTDILCPTIHYNSGPMGNIPIIDLPTKITSTERLVEISKTDWDSFEFSWDFEKNPLFKFHGNAQSIKDAYLKLFDKWQQCIQQTKQLEEENNEVFINAYGLQKEEKQNISIDEVTLSCNPHYRYKSGKAEDELEALLLQDTMKEFISYAVGCMFGRYSLDKPGLVLANAGETLEDYLQQVPEPTFLPDDDNVIPLMDVDWFEDDIAERFKTFLRVTFGEDNYDENLTFIEEALGYKPTGKRKPLPIRDYFLKNFYTDHVKTYKKRPIYWMFSSKNGTFNALIYLHRYRPETINDLLNEYVREFGKKLTAHRDNKMQESLTAEGRIKVALEKEITKLNKQIEELDEYERDLFEFASQPAEALALDLDDGVKVNYQRFSPVLKKVTGLS